MADQVAHPAHLNARDTTLAFVSRAPQAEIQGLKERMGWELIPWYSITDDFDADFGVDEWHGHNAFIRDGDKIFRTYFIDARGDEALGTTWSYLDITALGRQEEWEDSPGGLPADAALRVVELPRRLRRSGRVIAHVGASRVEELLPVAGRRRRGAADGARLARCCGCGAGGSRAHDRGPHAAHGAHLPRHPPRRSSTRGPARR